MNAQLRKEKNMKYIHSMRHAKPVSPTPNRSLT
jgi:hypothetical protein